MIRNPTEVFVQVTRNSVYCSKQISFISNDKFFRIIWKHLLKGCVCLSVALMKFTICIDAFWPKSSSSIFNCQVLCSEIRFCLCVQTVHLLLNVQFRRWYSLGVWSWKGLVAEVPGSLYLLLPEIGCFLSFFAGIWEVTQTPFFYSLLLKQSIRT